MVYLLLFFLSYLQYLILFLFIYFGLFKRILKGNKYFGGIKHTLDD